MQIARQAGFGMQILSKFGRFPDASHVHTLMLCRCSLGNPIKGRILSFWVRFALIGGLFVGSAGGEQTRGSLLLSRTTPDDPFQMAQEQTRFLA